MKLKINITLSKIIGRQTLGLLCLLLVVFEAKGADRLEVFAGSASSPALKEVVALYEETTGVSVELHFGGSGTMLAQMELAGRGDIYFPGSSDFMEKAKRKGLVDPATETIVAYLLPTINVPRGNPLNIRTLEDLGRPGLRLGIARPDVVCVGLYGVEVLRKAGLDQLVLTNVVNEAESCSRVYQMLSLGTVDAVLGWDVMDDWDRERVETVYLAPEQVTRIGYMPAAVATFSANPQGSIGFIRFMSGERGRAVFKRYGYVVTEAAARTRTLPDTPVGGELTLPPGWRIHE